MARVLDCTDPAARAEPLAEAVRQIRRGRIAAVPDQAMVLLVADAFSDYGVNRLRLTKGRDDLPSTVLIGRHATIAGIATAIPAYAHDLMHAFWPGPLTLLLRQQPALRWPLAGPTLPVRMPLHPLTLALVRELGPTASTGANRAGSAPAASVADAVAEFDRDVDVYLDCGAVPPGPRSTVVDATGAIPVLRRTGAVSLECLSQVCAALEVTTG